MHFKWELSELRYKLNEIYWWAEANGQTHAAVDSLYKICEEAGCPHHFSAEAEITRS